MTQLNAARKYVHDPSEAPEGYKPQQGERGGWYYETEAQQPQRAPMDGDAWTASLSREEKQALKTWTLGRWKEMRNAELEQGEHKLLDAFHSAVARAPLYSGSVVRGLRNLTKKQINELMTAEEITFNATSSASKNGMIAAGFARGKGGIMLRIKQKTGSDITPGVAANNAESEVLLHPGTSYRRIGTGTYVKGGVAIPTVDLEEV